MSISIRTKILLSFAVISVLLSFLGGLSIYNRNLLFRGMLQFEQSTGELKAISDMKLALDMVVMPPNDYLITADPSERQRFDQLAVQVEAAFSALDEIGIGKEYPEVEEARAKFGTLRSKAISIFNIKEPIGSRAGARLMEEIDAISSEIILNHLDTVYVLKREGIKARIGSASALRSRVDMALLLGSMLSVLTLLLLAFYLFRAILNPLKEFKESAHIIGNGNLDHRISIRDGTEINLLADEFNRMAGRLGDSYADLERKIQERTRELAESNKMLKELSITDGLTGLFNHRYLYEKLEDEVKRALRYGKKLSLIMIDIDFFKHYNDVNGHPEGDKVLKEIAYCISRGVRAQDLVARYGGEEFSIILPETGKEETLALAERIRRDIKEKVFPFEEKQPGGDLTISLGLASYPEDAKEAGGLLKKADDALYRAKELGRNRVEVAE